MSTVAQIRTAFSTYVFTNASITVLTDKIYDYDITLESTKEYSKLRYRTEINFLTYLVTRAQKPLIMGQFEQTFTVRIRYGKQADVAGSVFKAVSDVFETIQDLVQNQLGSTWNNSVDYYRVQNGPPNMEQQEIENLPVWVGTYEFLGYRYTG